MKPVRRYFNGSGWKPGAHSHRNWITAGRAEVSEAEGSELLAQDAPECVKHPALCPICGKPLPMISHYCRECCRIVCPECYVLEEGKCRECVEEATG